MIHRFRKGNWIAVVALWLLCAICSPLPAFAAPATSPLLKTADGIYQSLHFKLIQSLDPAFLGYFVYISSEPLDIQLFDYNQLKPGKGNVSFFLRYAPESNHFSELHIEDSVYRVNGNFRLIFNALRVTVDNHSGYVSFVNDGESPWILGFNGLEEIMRINNTDSGEDLDLAIAVLEANPNNYGGVVAPYHLKADGKLYLRDQPVEKRSIGLDLEPPKNPCLTRRESGRVAYLPVQQVLDIWKDPNKINRVEALRAAVEANSETDPLREALLLSITDERLVALDFTVGSVYSIEVMKRKLFGRVLCLVKELDLTL